MRDILFRGKCIDKDEWTKGFYDASPKGNHYITSVGHSGCAVCRKVHPHTVGQYSGLKDENGVSIFEGDIVNGLFVHGMYVKGVVGFENGAFGVRWGRGDAIHFTPFTSTCNVTWDVVGNVHDNPEVMA